jgi:ferredoxin--NADP+ reductase
MILQLVPYGWDFPDFRPGQFAFLGLPGSAARCRDAIPDMTAVDPDKLITRAYGIASSPLHREYLEFYVALVPDGILTPRLFNLRIGDRVWLSRMPSGGFGYDKSVISKATRLVLCANDGGIAPLVSLVGTHLKSSPELRVALIHGVRNSWDLGYRSVFITVQDLRSNFTYLPTISRPEEEFVPWKGHIGSVRDVWKSGAIQRAWRSRAAAENTHVFLCGSPEMSGPMIELLGHEGFKADTESEAGQIHAQDFRWDTDKQLAARTLEMA